MSGKEDIKLEYGFLSWAESIEDSQSHMYTATKRLRKILKSKHEKLTKERIEEIATVLGDLKATVDSITEMLERYLRI